MMDRWIEDHIVDHTPGFLSSSERHFLALGEPFVSSLVPPSSIKHTSLEKKKITINVELKPHIIRISLAKFLHICIKMNLMLLIFFLITLIWFHSG